MKTSHYCTDAGNADFFSFFSRFLVTICPTEYCFRLKLKKQLVVPLKLFLFILSFVGQIANIICCLLYFISLPFGCLASTKIVSTDKSEFVFFCLFLLMFVPPFFWLQYASPWVYQLCVFLHLLEWILFLGTVITLGITLMLGREDWLGYGPSAV